MTYGTFGGSKPASRSASTFRVAVAMGLTAMAVMAVIVLDAVDFRQGTVEVSFFPHFSCVF